MADRPEGSGPLPIDAVLGTVCAAAAGGRVVVAAEPGSGKTTRVPLALAAARPGRVVVLEPRRVAARAMARFLAAARGEAVGGFIGLTTRDERLVSDRTRVEFVTEGVLTRRLQRDPELRGVGAVVFDEFHERSLAADTGLALTLDAADGLRPDLAVVVMSATLDVEATAGLLGGAPVVRTDGRAHPVDTHFRPCPASVPIEAAAADAVVEALQAGDGDVLVFLAGTADIRRVERRLATALPAGLRTRVDVWPLHGQLPPGEQDRALAPAPPGRRKVVLATNVAETSLTVAGVTAVVDSGLVRRLRTAGGDGRFGSLVTERISRAEAEQRRGRAGRQGPGRCYRLWAERDHAGLRPAPLPEILTRDLTGLALELAAWGVGDPAGLAWLDPPPADALTEGRRTLQALGLLDEAGRPGDDGRDVLRLGLEPRAGAVVLAGRRLGTEGLRTACALAALLEEGDPFTGRTDRLTADLGLRLDAIIGTGGRRRGGPASALPPGAVGGADVELPEGRRRRLQARADVIERRARGLAGRTGGRGDRAVVGPTAAGNAVGDRTGAGAGPHDDLVAELLLHGLADRLAQRREEGGGRFVLRHGGGVRVQDDDPLARAPFLVVADAGAAGGDTTAGARGGPAADLAVRLAFPVPSRMLPAGQRVVSVRWDPTIGEGGDVSARVEERLDALVRTSGPLRPADLSAAEATPALLEGVRRNGFRLLGNHEAADALRHRVAFCRRVFGPDDWPDLSDAALLGRLDDWLGPWLGAARRRRDLTAVDCRAVWWGLLPPTARAGLDRLAPARVTVPTGRDVAIDYEAERPTLAVKLQELFGLRALPVLADGRERLVVHLLSPAGRPVAVTDDLERFWTGAYHKVRSELRGRYPKHPWPEDPLHAIPTAATKRRAR